MTPYIVFAYVAVGLAVRLWLIATWLRMGVARKPDDQISDFVACVVFWPVMGWFVWAMWRGTQKGEP